ncbi:MAG: CvpA family protein [Betaproteobacteria bacterium]|nr:CvpA family protein [Betaproteobacteria bacterium]NBT74918.1 CvpA family protein [Betaproteobacteria bacterium]NBY13216.1 CvpA family protein [Betaproteobacteria bacterium]NCA15754.1 CvpA family protein [Betaproteobacteria bacterium]NDF04710.1 CvpA family protein [Betaproteobacteria bacterium]
MGSLTWIDIILLVLVCASILLSMLRGLVQEIASLGVWVLALVGASRLASTVGEAFTFVESEPIRLTLAFAVVFIIALILGRLVTLALKELVQATGATVLDRVLGSLFGLARGLVIVAALAVLGAMTPLPSQPAWQESVSRPLLDLSIHVTAPWLPDFLASRVSTPKPGAT